MLSSDDSLHVHDSGRIIHSDDSNGKNRRRYRRKTSIRTRRKNALREHPFLPKEITDKIISFANSFGFRVILVAKAGRLMYSNKAVDHMAAYCCVYYVDSKGLKVGLASYRFGKVSFADTASNNKLRWSENFILSYRCLAEKIQSAVLEGLIEPVVVPGLFLKSSNVTCC